MIVLKDLFSSSVRADVLSVLLNNPDERFYMREIANLIRKNPSGVKRELDRLEKMGIVISEKVANLKYFRANKESPLYSELKDLIAKSLGLPGALKALLRASGAKVGFIYGPYACGEDTTKVDLLVVGASSVFESGVKNLEKKFGVKINYILLDEEDYRQKKRRRDSNLKKILSEKRITLIGRA
ncbi:MAG: winged helix-turn-helix domain-containing protein [Thermodesulfovibrionales bacterium]|nr:winged helix-turn-helix domain-containing protein [Thermodesulfovibrionales bacterium]